MGFSGGGSGQLLNHEHDGTLALDGGPLDFKNITQSSMSLGSITYSDGNHLQELIKPAVPANDILQFATAASGPSWTTDPFIAGGKLEFLGSHSNVAEEETFTFTFTTPVDFTQFSAIVVYFSYDMDAAASAFNAQLILNGNTAGSYNAIGHTQSGTTLTGFSSLSQANWIITDTSQNTGNDNTIQGMFEITSHKGPATQQYPAISSHSCSWTNTTRTFLGTKVANMGSISSVTLTSDAGAGSGFENGLWNFYGIRI